MIVTKKFYMIRHGQSVANRDKYFSGNLDVELTDLGRTQADSARQILEALSEKPTRIVHSHLQRARITAEIINQNVNLPMTELTDIGEHYFGDWEGKDYIPYNNGTRGNPPNGETNKEFETRVIKGLNAALKPDGTPLIACHGGVFRAFYSIYNNAHNFEATKNCVLYRFTPDETTPHFPWKIEKITA